MRASTKKMLAAGIITTATMAAHAQSMSGRAVYESACKQCHETGVANAPRVGDKARWAPLIKEGLAELTTDAIKGKGQMPPKGGRPELTRAEIGRAIVYMANESGARWKEPR